MSDALEAARRIVDWQCARDGNAIDDIMPFAEQVARALLAADAAAYRRGVEDASLKIAAKITEMGDSSPLRIVMSGIFREL